MWSTGLDAMLWLHVWWYFSKRFSRSNPKTFIMRNNPLFSALTDKKTTPRNFINPINLKYHNSKRIINFKRNLIKKKNWIECRRSSKTKNAEGKWPMGFRHGQKPFWIVRFNEILDDFYSHLPVYNTSRFKFLCHHSLLKISHNFIQKCEIQVSSK